MSEIEPLLRSEVGGRNRFIYHFWDAPQPDGRRICKRCGAWVLRSKGTLYYGKKRSKVGRPGWDMPRCTVRQRKIRLP